MSSIDFDMDLIVNKLKQKRKVFVSEADFQLELAWVIKENYPDAKIRLEYPPSFDLNMHIDILVVIDNKWYPLAEFANNRDTRKRTLTAKRGTIYSSKGEVLAKDVNSYLYLKDIMRIEKVRNNINNFGNGYTMFITNDLSYMKKPLKDNCVYREFSLEDRIVKKGKMFWSKNASKGTMKNCEEPIILNDSYNINWKCYSKLDNENTGTFIYVINEIKNN